MGSVAAGTAIAWTANLDSKKLEAGDFNDIKISEDNLSWIGSFFNLGAMCICFPIALICDWIGRKLAMLLLVIPFTLGWLLIIFSQNVEMIYAGRFILGLSGGAFCVSAPMYTSEIAQKEIRGGLGSYFQLLLTCGILFANIIAYVADALVYSIICACIPIVFGVVFFLQPETPVYSAKKGKDKAASKALVKLRGKSYDVEGELQEIKSELQKQKDEHMPFMQSFKKRATKKALMITFGLMFFQQMSGINAVIYYTSNIFAAAKVTIEPEIATIMVGAFQVVATFVSSLIVDKLGRRILLLGSDFLMALSTLLLGIYFSLQDRNLADKDTLSDIGFLPVLALCVFIVVFSLGFGPIPWMIAAEVCPPEVKSVLSSAGGTFNWGLAFLVTKFYSSLKEAIGGDSTFYIFTGFSLLGTVFVYFIVPETKGKSLSDIQRELNGEKISKEEKLDTGYDNLAYENVN